MKSCPACGSTKVTFFTHKPALQQAIGTAGRVCIMTEKELTSYGKRLWALQEKGFTIKVHQN